MRSLVTFFRTIPLEAMIWTAGLAILAVAGPYLEGRFTVCIPTLMGFDFCPGCGLGTSVAYLLRGDLASSWAAHPLGVPAVLILGGRIASLLVHQSRSIHST